MQQTPLIINDALPGDEDQQLERLAHLLARIVRRIASKDSADVQSPATAHSRRVA